MQAPDPLQGAVPLEHYKAYLAAKNRLPLSSEMLGTIGPVASWKKGTPYRRLADTWSADPKRPDTHERCLHYTKGWRYRRVVTK